MANLGGIRIQQIASLEFFDRRSAAVTCNIVVSAVCCTCQSAPGSGVSSSGSIARRERLRRPDIDGRTR